MALIKVADESEITEDIGFLTDIDGIPIAIFKIGGEYFAIDNTCHHKGGPLNEGEVEDHIVTCPLHGWQYDLTTGMCLTMPGVQMKTYPVQVKEDGVYLDA